MRNSIGILLVFFLFQFLATSSALLISGMSLSEMQEMSSEQQQSFNVVLCYTMLAGNLLMIGVLYVLKYVRKNMFRSFFIDETEENQQVSDRLNAMSYFWAILAFLLFSVALSFVLTPLQLDDGGSTSLFDSVKTNPLCLLLLCVVGPLGEEVVFREGIMRQLILSKHTPFIAAAISALFFALFHGNLAQGIPAFVTGVLLGYLFLQSGSIRLSWAAHIANNTLGVILLYFPEAETSIMESSSVTNILIAFALVTLSMGCCKMLTYQTENSYASNE